MSLIRLNDVNVRFDNTQILREAFFRLEPGDRVGLIGRNGSGKTTILKLVLDQVDPGHRHRHRRPRHQDRLLLPVLRAERRRRASPRCSTRCSSRSRPSKPSWPRSTRHRRRRPRGGAELDRLIHRQAELFEDMDRLDGWDYARADRHRPDHAGIRRGPPHLRDRRALRRLAQPRRAGEDPAREPRRAAARRAHQLPRRGRRRVARGLVPGLPRAPPSSSRTTARSSTPS